VVLGGGNGGAGGEGPGGGAGEGEFVRARGEVVLMRDAIAWYGS
jgi:hypothetical protein